MSEVQGPDLSVPAAVADPLADVGCKTRLQQYTQKAGMAMPVYQTVNEGLQHAPHFRSRIWVDETFYTSPMTCSTRKAAEQSCARYALIQLREKARNEARTCVMEDIVFCKGIINEYAMKMNIEVPVYVTTTSQSQAVVSMFKSSLSLNGATYIGDAAKTKKEAEQLAARAAILSILESETDTTTMSEIMKSKAKLYEELSKAKGHCMDSGTVQISPLCAEKAPMEDPNPIASVKRKEVETSGLCPIPDAPSGSIEDIPRITQPVDQPFHEFKKQKSQTSEEEMITPITFVPPSTPPAPLCPAPSPPVKKRKNKKKKKTQQQSSLRVGTFPPTHVPACSA